MIFLINLLKLTVIAYQILSLIFADLIFSLFRNKKRYFVVFGVTEIAGFLFKLSGLFTKSFTVCLYNNRSYDHKYSFKNHGNYFIRRIVIVMLGPWLLGYLINMTETFFYTYSYGFLMDLDGSRAFEFSYLKFRKKIIICIFLGSEIRSLKKLYEFGLSLEQDTIATYKKYNETHLDNEEKKKKLAIVTDKYADVIFNASVDQISYLTSATSPIFYIVKDDEFHYSHSKFNNLSTIKIIHAPTDPLIKGTQVVRAVVKKLQSEGYSIDYSEMFNKKNEEVLKELKTSHIAINQLYAFIPSVFGIECMANHVALLTSADRKIEKDLPPGSENAWITTNYWNLYDNLKYFISNPSEIVKQADKGYYFVLENYHIDKISDHLFKIINQVQGETNVS